MLALRTIVFRYIVAPLDPAMTYVRDVARDEWVQVPAPGIGSISLQTMTAEDAA